MSEPITRLNSRVLYHGGSYPVPSVHQKGRLVFDRARLVLTAVGKRKQYPIHIDIPIAAIVTATTEEQKYYSSTAYMLIIEFDDESGRRDTIELEIRSFGRRGRAQAISRLWAQTLSETKGGITP